jgi:hypothetical protein
MQGESERMGIALQAHLRPRGSFWSANQCDMARGDHVGGLS